MNTQHFTRQILVAAFASVLLLLAGSGFEAKAQRDPFAKASYMKQRDQNASGASAGPKAHTPPPSYDAPMIEARIDYYKRMRAAAAEAGQPIPKVTSVLTLNELNVTGIFKTPRGWAAMVEAAPIKLSYTIYPGEKFFDGQLVAVEENRLVFRKVTKTGPKKFTASVEYKPLQTYSTRAQIEGTAPASPGEKPVQRASNEPPAAGTAAPPAPAQMMPFVDEMTNAPDQPAKDKKRPTGKPVKVARKN